MCYNIAYKFFFTLRLNKENKMYNTQELKLKLKKIEGWLIKEYSSIRTGHATPMVLDNVMVENYGSKMPIKNIAQISIEDSKTLRIIPWDKSHIKNIETAIMSSNLGLSVVSDGEGVRIIFPLLTTENRSDLIKILKEKMENARINVRKERQDEIDKTSDLSEDNRKRAKDDIQKCVEEANKNLEEIFIKKETDLMNN